MHEVTDMGIMSVCVAVYGNVMKVRFTTVRGAHGTPRWENGQPFERVVLVTSISLCRYPTCDNQDVSGLLGSMHT